MLLGYVTSLPALNCFAALRITLPNRALRCHACSVVPNLARLVRSSFNLTCSTSPSFAAQGLAVPGLAMPAMRCHALPYFTALDLTCFASPDSTPPFLAGPALLRCVKPRSAQSHRALPALLSRALPSHTSTCFACIASLRQTSRYCARPVYACIALLGFAALCLLCVALPRLLCFAGLGFAPPSLAMHCLLCFARPDLAWSRRSFPCLSCFARLCCTPPRGATPHSTQTRIACSASPDPSSSRFATPALLRQT